jgi:hypothetical protein
MKILRHPIMMERERIGMNSSGVDELGLGILINEIP